MKPTAPTTLISFPRSGRHMVHKMLTAGYGMSPAHVDQLSPGAVDAPITVTHDVVNGSELFGRRRIVLIRDPLQCFASWFVKDYNDEFCVSGFRERVFGAPECTGWIDYWKDFVRQYILWHSRVESYQQVTLGYWQFVNNPELCLRRMVCQIGGSFDMHAAMGSVDGVAYRNDHRDFVFYQDTELTARIKQALYPEVAQVAQMDLI